MKFPFFDSRAASPLSSVLVLVAAMVSIQFSASLAKSMFQMVGPVGTTALRLCFSSVILFLVLRPWKHPIPASAYKMVVLYGLSLGFMNLCFYSALERIPLGIAVALEFTGPLGVALYSSKKAVDFVWVGLALVGLLLLLPIRQSVSAIDPVGAALALAAGACWATYIVFGQKAGAVDGMAAVSLGTLVAAGAVLPIGISVSGLEIFRLEMLPWGLLLGVFASALPYSLEMIALRRLPAHTFGTLMSLEPAVAALSGFVMLNENLAFSQWMALLCIIIASMGSALTLRRAKL